MLYFKILIFIFSEGSIQVLFLFCFTATTDDSIKGETDYW